VVSVEDASFDHVARIAVESGPCRLLPESVRRARRRRRLLNGSFDTDTQTLRRLRDALEQMDAENPVPRYEKV
jgi:hypothetical protein